MKLIDADAFEKYLAEIHDRYTREIEDCEKQGNVSGASYLRTHKELLVNIMLELKQQPAANPWIPVSQIKPKNRKAVLVIARPDHDSMSVKFTATYDKERDVWFVQTGENTAAYPHEYKPVYWMPIPELKEER